ECDLSRQHGYHDVRFGSLLTDTHNDWCLELEGTADSLPREVLDDMGRWGTLLTVAGMLVLGAALPAQTGYKMIVNPSNPIESVSKAQAARFFLENAVWDDGRPATAVDLPPTSP